MLIPSCAHDLQNAHDKFTVFSCAFLDKLLNKKNYNCKKIATFRVIVFIIETVVEVKELMSRNRRNSICRKNESRILSHSIQILKNLGSQNVVEKKTAELVDAVMIQSSLQHSNGVSFSGNDAKMDERQ